MHAAASTSCTEILRLLVSRGADLTVRENDGCTPLHIACFSGSLAAVKLLIELGANMSSESNDGSTGLHWAAGNGHDIILQYMHKLGANINQTNHEGRTPLHLAAYCGNLETVALLCSLGADVSLRDHIGSTAYHLAALTGNSDVMEYLRNDIATISKEKKAAEEYLPVDMSKSAAHVVIQSKSVVSNQPNDACAFCGATAALRCGRCKRVRYCSQLCQTSDWKNHKILCASSQGADLDA